LVAAPHREGQNETVSASNTDQPNMIALVSEVDGERQSLGDTGGRGDLCQRFPGSCDSGTPGATATESTYPEPYEGYWHGVGQIYLGYWDAAVSTVEGAATVIMHPIATAQGIGNSIYHYDETLNAIKEGLTESTRTNRGIGSLVGNALIGVATGGAIKSATTAIKASRLAKGAPKPNTVAPVREVVSAAGVRRVPGRLYDAPQRAALKKYLDRNNVGANKALSLSDSVFTVCADLQRHYRMVAFCVLVVQ